MTNLRVDAAPAEHYVDSAKTLCDGKMFDVSVFISSHVECCWRQSDDERCPRDCSSSSRRHVPATPSIRLPSSSSFGSYATAQTVFALNWSPSSDRFSAGRRSPLSS